MANFCLPPAAVDKFTNALRSGKIDPYKLRDMTSDERRAIFKDIVGENGAKQVNAEFEAKTLLKNQNLAYTNWAKKVAGITPETRRDLISKIQRLDHVLSPEEEKPFLQDLASQRLGVGVTQEEAKNISDLSHAVTEGEAKAKPDGTFASKDEALKYSNAKVDLEDYVNDLKLKARNPSTRNPAVLLGRGIKGTPGFLKSSLSTLDNSFYGRQGIKVLFNPRTTDIWVKDWLKSWGDIARELKGTDAMRVVKSDVYARPNSVNGKYRAGNYGLDALSEEAYPSHAAAKIPLLKRLYKASESAYNGGALRMRADLADRFIKIAEKQGVNTLDREQARGIGTLIGEMTGRGSLNSRNSWTNSLLFSPKFLKANFDGLTLHAFDKNATSFTRKEAAKNMAGVVTSTAALLGIADKLAPGSVDFDPRSSHFGKIKIKGNWVDVTGGQGALLTLAARTLVPTKQNGKWGLYTKDNKGKVTNLLTNKYGAQNALDIINNFWEGKLAPTPGILRDIYTQDTYQGTKPTVKGEVSGATTPISIQTYNQLKDSGNAGTLAGLIADGLGFSVTTPNNNNAGNKQALPGAPKEIIQTLNNADYKVSNLDTKQRGKDLNPQQYKQFVSKTNQNFIQAVNKARNTPTFKNYTPDQQKTSLGGSLTKAKAKALDNLSIKKPARAKPVKSY